MAFMLRKPRVFCNSAAKSLAKALHKSTIDETALDSLTEFTDNLMSKRQLRWKILQQEKINRRSTRLQDVANLLENMKRATEKSVSEVMFLSVDFEKLNENHLDHFVLTACRDKNHEFIEKFIDQCVDDNKVITETSVLTMCEYFSSFSDNRTLVKLIELCKLNNRNVYDKNCEFKHFVARNMWEKGNSDGALSLLDETYEQADVTMRPSVRSIFHFVVEDTVDKRSEAVLLRLIKSAVLLHKTMNEPAVLLHLWDVCFLSNWFSDQVLAGKLFLEHSEVRTSAVNRRGVISYNALCSGQVDVVHRLIQLFLKFDMTEECKLILELLFEYQYACKDLRACSEIMKTTLELNINLSNTYNLKLLDLLMGEKCRAPKAKKQVTPKFDLKF